MYFYGWSKVDIALNAKFRHFGASACTSSITGCLREPFNPDIFSYKTGELNLSLFQMNFTYYTLNSFATHSAIFWLLTNFHSFQC